MYFITIFPALLRRIIIIFSDITAQKNLFFKLAIRPYRTDEEGARRGRPLAPIYQ